MTFIQLKKLSGRKGRFSYLIELFNLQRNVYLYHQISKTYCIYNITKNYLNFIIFEENISFEVVDGFIYNIYILSLKKKEKQS